MPKCAGARGSGESGSFRMHTEMGVLVCMTQELIKLSVDMAKHVDITSRQSICQRERFLAIRRTGDVSAHAIRDETIPLNL